MFNYFTKQPCQRKENQPNNFASISVSIPLLVKKFQQRILFCINFPSSLLFLQEWAESIANFIEFYQLPPKVNFSFLARTNSKKKNFAILSGKPIVPAIEGNHRRRIATALSSYEPVSVENDQSWTIKKERQFFMKLLLCYDTFDPFNPNNSIHIWACQHRK